jgi:hypothetical protein
MLLARRACGMGRVLAAALADCPSTPLTLLQPHTAGSEALLGCRLHPSISPAAAFAVSRRPYSQIPDAERILHGTPLDAHHALAQAEESHSAEEGHQEYSTDHAVQEERQKLLEASLQHVVSRGSQHFRSWLPCRSPRATLDCGSSLYL